MPKLVGALLGTGFGIMLTVAAVMLLWVGSGMSRDGIVGQVLLSMFSIGFVGAAAGLIAMLWCIVR